MKYPRLPLLALLPFGFSYAAVVSGPAMIPALKPVDRDRLKYEWKSPARDQSYDGLCLGNGSLGVRVNGGVKTESLQLNHSQFWSGEPLIGLEQNPKRREAMEAVRAKLAAGDIPGADAAARGEFRWGVHPDKSEQKKGGMGGPLETGSFKPVGTIYLDFDHEDKASDYVRKIDLGSAVASVSYKVGGVTYTREYFTSYPDKVMVARIKADKPGAISFTARFKCPEQLTEHCAITAEGADTLAMTEQAPTFDFLSTGKRSKHGFWNGHGITVSAKLRVIPSGGKVTPSGDGLRVEGANAVTLLYSAATDWAGPFKLPGTGVPKPAAVVSRIISSASGKTPDSMLDAHLADYRSLFDRLSVSINDTSSEKSALKWQYARYGMICCSRDGDRPHNQQGIWCHQWNSINYCAHFLNENVQKHYAFIEASNLANVGEPLWNWMGELAVNGAETAKTDWGFKGWMAPHCSDNWASTCLKGGDTTYTFWPMGGAWLCQNLWESFAFSGDREFLRKRAYPIMKGAAEFCLDLLVDDGTGHLVTSPSSSAENRFKWTDGKTYGITRGSTGDQVIIGQLFENCIEASTILGVDAPFRDKLKAARAKMLAPAIGKAGDLVEWPGDLERFEEQHRHVTHLLGVWPLAQVTERGTPELFAANIRSMELRKGGGYHPDKTAMWARMKNGDKALKSLEGGHHGQVGGQWSPLFAGMPEMLLFSHNRDAKGAYELELLPSLPGAWKSGKVDGLRARGGYDVSLEWADGKLKKAVIDSRFGTVPTIRYENKLLDPKTDPRITVNLVRR